MPRRRYEPAVPLPGTVQEAVDVLLLTTVRLEILRDLARHPEGSTTVEIAARIDANYRTVWTHMKPMKEHGLVTAEGSVDRLGPVYRIVPEQVEKAFAVTRDYALGR